MSADCGSLLNDADSELVEPLLVGHLLESDGGTHARGSAAHDDYVRLVGIALHLDPGPGGIFGVDGLDGGMGRQDGVASGS